MAEITRFVQECPSLSGSYQTEPVPSMVAGEKWGAVPLSRERLFDVLSAHQPGRKDAPWKLQVNDMTTPFASTAAFPKRGLRGFQELKPVSRLRGTAPEDLSGFISPSRQRGSSGD